jgi:hypothetical protein
MSLLTDVYKEIDILQERIHVVYVACRRYRHQHARVVKLYFRRTLIWHPCIKFTDGSWESRHVDLVPDGKIEAPSIKHLSNACNSFVIYVLPRARDNYPYVIATAAYTRYNPSDWQDWRLYP